VALSTQPNSTNKVRWFCDTSNRRRKILPEEDQKKFLAKEFVSFEFVDLSPKQEEDLFARVQMGVQLSVAEKMRASTGPWQELARLFVDDFPVIYSLMKDKARAKDFQLTLSCFSQIVEVMHPTAADGVPILKTNHNALPKLLSNEGAVDDKIKSHLASVWSTFKDLIDQDEDVFTNANKYLRGVQTFAPVEMVAVVVLISIYSETRNKSLLLGDIRAMREAIRENFVDIRMNTSVWKFVWEFIDGLESIRGATNGSTVDRRVQPPSTNATAPVQRPMPTSTVMTGTEATVRTKPAQVLPARVKKEGHPSAPPSSRRPKRQRTDDNPSSLPVAQPLQVQSSPIPSRVSAAPVVQTLPLALNSHRASMTSTAPAALASPIRPTLAAREASPVSQLVVSAYSPTTTGHQSTLGSSVSTLKTSLGAFSPEHTEQQWAGIVRPTSSPHEPSLIAFSSHRGPLAKPRNTPRQPVPAQYNDFIDLTSDTEKERQDLLSAFKVKSPATEQRQTIIQSLGPKHNTHDQHRTRGYNNPYTRFKQEQNIVP
jgi:hypothetical protein